MQQKLSPTCVTATLSGLAFRGLCLQAREKEDAAKPVSQP